MYMYIHVCWYDGRETISQNIISRDRYRIENYKLAGGGGGGGGGVDSAKCIYKDGGNPRAPYILLVTCKLSTMITDRSTHSYL